METKIYHITDPVTDRDKILEAAEIIRNGGIVAFPTDTVYAIGASLDHNAAIEKMFEIKNRPKDNPVSVLVGRDLDMHLCIDIINPNNQICSKFIEAFWPGPLTVIMPRILTRVPSIVTGGKLGVGVRQPNNAIAQALLLEADVPVVAPSANLSGKPSPTTGQHVIDDFNGKIDMILVGPDECSGIESTIVDLMGEYPVITRPGAVTIDELQELIPRRVFQLKEVPEDDSL